MQTIPAIIRAEAQARGWSLTEDAVTIDGLIFWKTTSKNAIAFDFKKSQYVIRKL